MVTYVIGLQDWRWALGTGIFIDDIRATVAAARAGVEDRIQRNFLYIGATTLLTEAYQPQEKALIQGINEFMVFSATAFTAMASGYLHHTLGWESLNRYTLPVICFAAAIITLLGWQLRQQRAQAA